MLHKTFVTVLLFLIKLNIRYFAAKIPHCEYKADKMCDECYCPRDGVREIDGFDNMKFGYLKYCRYPDKAESARSDKGHDHWENGITYTAHCECGRVHHSAQEVWNRTIFESYESDIHNGLSVGIYPEKFISEEGKGISEYYSRNYGTGLTDKFYFPNTL